VISKLEMVFHSSGVYVAMFCIVGQAIGSATQNIFCFPSTSHTASSKISSIHCADLLLNINGIKFDTTVILAM